jgi:hypothetical protein
MVQRRKSVTNHRTPLAIVIALVATLALGACTGTDEDSSEVSSQASSGDLGASDKEPAADVTGVRGFPAGDLKCGPPAQREAVEGTEIGAPIELLMVCPETYSKPAKSPGVPVIVVPNSKLSLLLEALSRPGEHLDPDLVCAAVVMRPNIVYGMTAEGLFRIEVPTDSCGFEIKAARRLIDDIQSGRSTPQE